MSFAERLAKASAAPLDEGVLDDLARSAMDEGEEERALPLLESAARQTDSAHLWRWTGLLQRSLDDQLEAFASFKQAQLLDPGNQAVAHSLARTALEAGWDSVAQFEQALQLGPPSSDLLIGLAAAHFARGEGEEAAESIARILDQVPNWYDGHRQLAQLRAVLGEPSRSTESFERALERIPGDEGLWVSLLDHNVAASDFTALDENVLRARGAGSRVPLDAYEAIAAGELGDTERADRLFALPGAPPIWHIRHLLRRGRAIDAAPIVDAELHGSDPQSAWPYALTVWRETGDERLSWLLGPDGFVRTFDLADSLPAIGRLADVLRTLHRGKGGFVDQSVRGGTQTDGPLFRRTEPEIQGLRRAIVEALERYIGGLPERDASHPLLGPRRDRRVRFAGSWSVRLRAAGHHERHVHTRGWISSALYLALPGGDGGATAGKGVLELGAPPDRLGLDQAPLWEIEPEVGKLVLFPSWLWHGTRPFDEGERLTVAFDVKSIQ